ncbi:MULTISPECIES: OsmC family protein [Enterobacteriaceae]|jgi:putative redox protein|uniref:OsmC family protein n=1 Tax=Enterobacteriaceae TaxID=543 RepID=UPI0007079329|nr:MULTISPECIES: OsmC family protein [Enterobacteriaceae]EKW2929246.1 OsmC family protein [Citrobacter amalonaticus]KAA0541421.1 OsmC family protein [Citrobacter portucalensis]MBD0807062.1 OsmC family protein [Citrobacter sp. C13]KQJ05973.1 osmotically inducible protein C [Escherichia coli]MBJ9334250.1 OsmC family protein [Citrobacter freundii]
MSVSTKPYIDMDAVKLTQDAVRAQPALGNVTFTMKGTSNGGVSVKVGTGPLIQNGDVDDAREGRFSLISDEPVALLGADTGVSPAEYILMGLAGCYTVTLTSLAGAKGIDLDGIELELFFDINLNGFLGLDDSVRKGAQGIRVDIKMAGEKATRAQLEELVRDLPGSSPIHDTLANPVTITTKLV